MGEISGEKHSETAGHMRILVGWDDSEEAELLLLYLNVDDNAVVIEVDAASFLETAASRNDWDVFLLPTGWPDPETAYTTFRQLRSLHPEPPIVAATLPGESFRLARFLTAGLRSYVIRDENKDYLFLMHAALSAAIDAVRAERERLIAEKLRQEVDSVRKLQESIIPRLLQMPSGYKVQGRYESAEIRVLGGQPVTMAGGDYYNALQLPDGNVALIVGDASGHGMKACMSIMTLHTLIQMFPTHNYRDTAQFVSEINHNLSQQTIVSEDGGFITLLYGILDPREHVFEWTSAGHPLPLLHRLKCGEVSTQGDPDDVGMPLGVWEEAEYVTQKIELPDNSRLLLYSDGLAEALREEDGKHQEFGLTGITGVLSESTGRPLEELVSALFHASHEFTAGVGRHDDTSVLIVQRD